MNERSIKDLCQVLESELTRVKARNAELEAALTEARQQLAALRQLTFHGKLVAPTGAYLSVDDFMAVLVGLYGRPLGLPRPPGDGAMSGPAPDSQERLQTYEIRWISHYRDSEMVECGTSGDWCKVDDVEMLLAKLRADTAALRAQLEEEQRKVRDGVSPCGHYRVFAMPCVLEDGTEQPYCMQCDRDELQTELAEARARLALPPQAQEPA